MTLAEENGPERGGDEILAAEYVLGVLPEDERLIAAARIDREPPFARLVDEWEVRFASLASAYPAVEPPASVKAAIDRRLFSERDETTAPERPPITAEATWGDRQGIWSSLAFWRGLAAAALAVLAIATAVPFFGPPVEVSPPRLVASLSAEDSNVRYLAVYDGVRHEVGLSHVSGERAADRDFELWMIEGGNAPVSIGVIPVGATAHLAIPEAMRAKLGTGAVLAVSVEPTGGSPTGKPTGPVVAAGDMKNI